MRSLSLVTAFMLCALLGACGEGDPTAGSSSSSSTPSSAGAGTSRSSEVAVGRIAPESPSDSELARERQEMSSGSADAMSAVLAQNPMQMSATASGQASSMQWTATSNAVLNAASASTFGTDPGSMSKAQSVNAAAVGAATGQLYWYNPATGDTVAWTVSGATKSASVDLLRVPGWRITQVADFNGDGQPDLLWLNDATGQTVMWLMNGNTMIESKLLLTDPNWRVIRTGDFNGDGKADLLWYNAAMGQTAIWLVNGTTLLTNQLMLGDPNWQITQVGDFDGDGKTDLLWYSPTYQQTVIWLMNGVVIKQGATVLSVPGWQAINVGDLDGDGKTDLIWYNAAAGQTAIWLMNGLTHASSTLVLTDPYWQVSRVADLNGDGKADLIWYAPALNSTAAWLMNGATRTASSTLLSVAGWQVTQAADFNGDGNADLVWTNASAGQTVVWMMNGLTQSSSTLVLTDPNYKLTLASNAAGSSSTGSTVVTNAPGLTTPAATAPVITSQPGGQIRIVGQTATFNVAVAPNSGTPSYAWQVSNDARTWFPVPGATSATLTVPGVSIDRTGTYYHAVVTNSAGSATSDFVELIVNWGSVATSSDLSTINSFYGGGGDGGGPGGGDGGGGDGGGGLGKTLNALMTVTRIADGALVGQALTDASTGLVKIKAGPGACPCLLTLSGTPTATYYDEGKGTYLPFDSTQVLHALVDKFDTNLGVSALTEAAYRYALNNYMNNPASIAAGTKPLQITGSVVGLTAAQIVNANNVVLSVINAANVQAYQLSSLYALPTPIDTSNASPTTLGSGLYGLSALVTGGLAQAAQIYNLNSVHPALDAAADFAADMTDGVIDGFGLDHQPSSSHPTYSASRFPIASSVAQNIISTQFGSSTLLPLASTVSEFSRGVTDATGNKLNFVGLLKDGSVTVTQNGIEVPNLIGNVNSLAVNGSTYFLKTNGTVWGIGVQSCGMVGNTLSGGFTGQPVQFAGLNGIQQIAVSDGSVYGRDSNGTVYAQGFNVYGLLGLPTTYNFDSAACTVASENGSTFTGQANLTPRVVPGLPPVAEIVAGQFAAYALTAGGTVYQWGYLPVNGTTQVVTPSIVSNLGNVVDIIPSGTEVVALVAGGKVYGWGFNGAVNLALGTADPVSTPTLIPGFASDTVVQIATDRANGYTALLSTGEIKVFEGETNGLPNGQYIGLPYTTPLTPPPGATPIYTLSGGVTTVNPNGTLPKIRAISTSWPYLYLYGADGKIYQQGWAFASSGIGIVPIYTIIDINVFDGGNYIPPVSTGIGALSVKGCGASGTRKCS